MDCDTSQSLRLSGKQYNQISDITMRCAVVGSDDMFLRPKGGEFSPLVGFIQDYSWVISIQVSSYGNHREVLLSARSL